MKIKFNLMVVAVVMTAMACEPPKSTVKETPIDSVEIDSTRNAVSRDSIPTGDQQGDSASVSE